MTAQQPATIDVPVYLVVEPEWRTGNYFRDEKGRQILGGGKVVKHTQNKPAVSRSGVVTKITLRMPASAFLPLEPSAIVIVGESDTETIVVTADAPEMGDAS